MIPLALTKNSYRSQLLRLRNAIPQSRKTAITSALLRSLAQTTSYHRYVLSFSSFRNEIDTNALNTYLASTKQLLLPKVVVDNLHIYHVDDIDTQCTSGKWNIIEPVPDRCKPASYHNITMAIIPGLGFDLSHNRLGYGKGYYDRLLKQLPHCHTYGLGFREQLIPHYLPTEHHDIPLSGLFLF